MIVRCYNCGIQGHKTQNCPSFGPRYPAPGKSGQDYGDEAQRIMQLFAADILAEHMVDEDDADGTVNWLAGKKLSPPEAAAREFICPTCGASVGQRCHTKSGGPSSCHKNRHRLAWASEVSRDGNEPNREGYVAEPATGTTGAGEAAQNR